MPADGMRATSSPERRFGTPASVARCKVCPSFLTMKRPSVQGLINEVVLRKK